MPKQRDPETLAALSADQGAKVDMTRKLTARDRAYFIGFVLGYCFDRHEAKEELRQIDAEFEEHADQLRAEVDKLVRQWGLPEQLDRDQLRVQ
jgi:hypothetical protein